MDPRSRYDLALTYDWEYDKDFVRLQALAAERGRDVIEGLDRIRWASDKATMHLEFLTAGILTPYTVILPAFAAEPDIGLTPEELAPLGLPFLIKPANTTGGRVGRVADAAGPAGGPARAAAA